ncbi:MAG: NAD(P)-dependent oxidoreductase [Saprospiraceae bacterium]|nr:NAD(P)-dependent oxidoreductase [Saprospiraceae bacterium]
MIKSGKLSALEYEKNFSDIHPPFYTGNAAAIEANRCLFCYDAPCIKACPTSINVPKFIKQIASNNIQGSAKTIFDSNIMGAACAKVCPVEKLCEGACVYNLMEEEPISIAKLQRFSAEKAITQKWPLYSRKPSIGKKIAVVGAGPAGLACAHALALEGLEIDIYEKEAEGGGLMTYGVAAYKVSPEICKDEVHWILSIGGIKVHYNQELGKDISLDELKSKYDAVFLGIGVGLARGLDIPGESLDGVVDAISFIYDIRTKGYQNIPIGDKVVVIGLGMTAIDAATQSKRLGAKEVTIAYRRTEDEKPCTDVELDIAKLDGCNLLYLASPKEIRGKDGVVQSIVFDKMELGDADANGRRKPINTGVSFTLETDMVIKAVGQVPYESLVESAGIVHDWGKVKLVEGNATNIEGVFAGGDGVNGGREVVDAVQAGKDGAHSILKYLKVI